MHAVFQGAGVLMDEVFDGRIAVIQAKLGKQGG